MASNNHTELHDACWKGHIDIARNLIERGAGIDQGDQTGDTPLHKACYKGHIAIVSLLIGARADLDHVNKSGQTPLSLACRQQSVVIARLLLENGADVSKARAKNAGSAINGLLREFKKPKQSKSPRTKKELEDELAATKARLETAHAAKVRLEAELAATKAFRDTEAAEDLAGLKADFAATIACLETELKRWCDGVLVCQHVIDVDTGAVTTTAVEAPQEAISVDSNEPPRKRPRPDERPSPLSQLVQVKTEAAQVTTRLQDELEDATDATLCTVCMEKPRDMVFVGCGHFLSCGECADKWVRKHGGACPQCRTPVNHMLPCKLV